MGIFGEDVIIFTLADALSGFHVVGLVVVTKNGGGTKIVTNGDRGGGRVGV